MKRFITIALICLSISTHAQLVPKDAKPEKVADGYKFTEGPALAPDGSIYFTDIPAELILKFDPETGKTKTVVENSGRANGLMFNPKGTLIACRGGARVVDSIQFIKTGAMFSRLAPDTYQGKRFNSPNDLTIDKAGNLYFTDPRYGKRDDMEMKIEGVYFLDNGKPGKDGRPTQERTVTRIDDKLTRPNGIILSPDEKILYVADNGANYIYAYDIESPGKLKNKRVFGRINDGKGGGSDGMCVDKQGRLYATGHGKVWAFEPTGQLVATIDVGKQTTNCTFGKDGKTLYITANKGLYRIKLNTDAKLEHAKITDGAGLVLPLEPEDNAEKNRKRSRLTMALSDPNDANSKVVIKLDQAKVTKDQLVKRLTKLAKQHPELILLIQIEPRVKHKEFVVLLEAAKKAGIQDLRIIALKADG